MIIPPTEGGLLHSVNYTKMPLQMACLVNEMEPDDRRQFMTNYIGVIYAQAVTAAHIAAVECGPRADTAQKIAAAMHAFYTELRMNTTEPLELLTPSSNRGPSSASSTSCP